jgi:plastocyanin
MAPLTSARSATLAVEVRNPEGAPVRDAVVSLVPSGHAAPAVHGATAVMDQRNLSFNPQLLVVQAGTRVAFPNSDNVRHHVYSFSPAKPFELKLYTGNHAASELFDQAGVVTVGCNIHDWMLGYIYVVDTPWFGKSDDNGQLLLDGVPPDTYTLTLWHPLLAAGSAPVTESIVLGATTQRRSFTVKLQPPEHSNKPPPDLEMGLGARMQHDDAH